MTLRTRIYKVHEPLSTMAWTDRRRANLAKGPNFSLWLGRVKRAAGLLGRTGTHTLMV